MTGELYQSRMARLRRVLFWNLIKKVLLDTILFFSLGSVVLLALQKLALLGLSGYVLYGYFLALTFLLSLLRHLRKIKSFTQELITIDIRLDLKERLSTAYEYHQKPFPSLLEELLKQEAADLLADLRKRKMLSSVFGWRHVLLPLALILLLALQLFDLKPLIGSPVDKNKEDLQQIGLKISQYVRQQQLASKKEESEKNAVSQQLLDMAREIDAKAADSSQVRETIQRMVGEVQEEQNKIRERLQNQLNQGAIQNIKERTALDLGQGAQATMDQLIKKIQDKYGDQIPDSMSKDLSDFNRNRRLEDFLNQTANKLQALSGNGDKPDAKSKNKRVLVASDQKTEENKNKEQSANRPPEAQRAKSMGSKPITVGLPDQDTDSKEGRGKESRPGNESAAQAGRGKGPDEKKEAYTLPTAKGDIFKDQGISNPAESYNANVRSLAKIAKANVPEEQIIRSYQQEVEETLQKEEIPAAYRNYIKNYFLNIGLRKEEKENDTNN
jgi:hypothetical protein